MLEVPDFDFIRPCGVVYALFYCRLDLCWDECYVGCPQPECYPVYVSVCPVCLKSDCVGELSVEGSLAPCVPMSFLCSILCRKCSGSSLHAECISPFVMLCLSAWRMMFVKMVFAVCMAGGGRMSEKAALMYAVKCAQYSPHVALLCCCPYLVRVLIVMIMGRRFEFSACIVCQVLRLYSVAEIVVMSGEVACGSVVCGTLVGV